MALKLQKTLKNKEIPTKLSEDVFNEFVLPLIPVNTSGPKSKIPHYKVFNYIMSCLYSGCQWKQLPIEKDENGKPEIHYTRIFKQFQRWGRAGVFEKLFNSSVLQLKEFNLIDSTILHGDGTTTIAKKGGDTIGYSGHKHFKGEKIVAISDRNCNVIATGKTEPANRHESRMFGCAFDHLKKV